MIIDHIKQVGNGRSEDTFVERDLRDQKDSDKEQTLKVLHEKHSELMKDKKLMKMITKVKSIMGEQGIKTIATSIDIDGDNSRSMSLDLNRKFNNNFTVMKLKGRRRMQNQAPGSAKNSQKNSSMIYRFLEAGIKDRFDSLSYSKIKIVNLLMFATLLLVSVYLKILNNNIIKSSGSTVNVVAVSQDSIQPQSFLLKEIEKKGLNMQGHLELNQEMQDMKIYDEFMILDMYDRVREDFLDIIERKYSDFDSVGVNFNKRGEILRQEIEDMGFATMFFSSVYDYHTIVKSIADGTNVFEDSIYFDSRSSIENIVQILDRVIIENDKKLDTYNQYIDTYKINYFIFASTTFFLSVIICIFITAVSIRINSKVVKITQLLLQIENGMIKIFKKRYEDLYNRKQRMKSMKERMMNIDMKSHLNISVSKGGDRGGIEQSKPMENTNKVVETDFDINSEKLREIYESKNQSRNIRYKTLGNHPSKTKGVIVILMILTTIFVNSPIVVDYFLQTSSIEILNRLNDASNYSAILSSAVISITGLFYSKINSIYSKSNMDDLQLKLFKDLDNKMNLRTSLQDALSVRGELDALKKVNICEFLKISQSEFELCRTVTNNERNYDIFLAINELKNYQRTIISTLEQSEDPSSSIISSVDFLKKDKLVYFLSKALVQLNLQIIDQVEKNLDWQINLTFVYFVTFPFALLTYYLIYRGLFVKLISKKAIKRLRNTFLALPVIVIANNSAMKNYFGTVKGRNGLIY